MALASVLKKTAGLSSASAINVALLSILSLALAKVLAVEEFGVTRSITAYLVILTMLGHMTFHDALATMLARTVDDEEKVRYFGSATWFVTLNSLVLALISYWIIEQTGYWHGMLKDSLSFIVLCLPLATIAILYNESLKVVGSTRTMALVQIVNGLVPFLVIIPAAYYAHMEGWLLSRVLAFIMLAGYSAFLVRRYLSFFSFDWSSFKRMYNFSKVQIFSGVLSLVLLSADIIVLERISGDMVEVAQYGLAAFFVKATMIVPNSIGRIYFKQIANGFGDGTQQKYIKEFIVLVVVVCVAMAISLFFLGPWIISLVYGEQYGHAAKLLGYLCIGLVFMGLWQAISMINIAVAKPGRSVTVAFVGAITGMGLLLLLVPDYGGEGAVWAMNIAYTSGVVVGLFMIFWNAKGA